MGVEPFNNAMDNLGVAKHTANKLINDFWPQYKSLETSITFAASTTGAVAVHDLFTVTGVVEIALIAVCTTAVTGSGTIQVGTALDTDALIAATTGSSITKLDIWHDAAPDNSVEVSTVITRRICAENIDYKITSNTLTAGVIQFVLYWTPISANGNVVVA